MTNTNFNPAPKQEIKPKDIEKAASFLEKVAQVLRKILIFWR